MKVAVLISTVTHNNIREIASWYQQRDPALAAGFRAELRQTIDRIQSNPRIYPRVYGLTRRAPLNRFPYLVMYRHTASTKLAEVLAVVHSSRHPARWQVQETAVPYLVPAARCTHPGRIIGYFAL